jgi:hypothetical protein
MKKEFIYLNWIRTYYFIPSEFLNQSHSNHYFRCLKINNKYEAIFLFNL